MSLLEALLKKLATSTQSKALQLISQPHYPRALRINKVTSLGQKSLTGANGL